MSMAYRYANGENIIMDLDRGDNVHQIKQKVISFTKMVADHLMESLVIRPWPARPRRFSGQNNWLSLARGALAPFVELLTTSF